MKVLLLIFAVIYCTSGHALQKDNGLRPAKRAVTGHGLGQVNSETYSIHKSREISKSAYLPPAIRDLPQTSDQSARQGITQLKPISTKLNSIVQQSANALSQNALQSGFIPVGNAFGGPVNREQIGQQQSRLSQQQSRDSQQSNRQPQRQTSAPKRTPHEKYGIPLAFSQPQQHLQSQALVQIPQLQIQHEQKQQSPQSSGYSSNASNRNYGPPSRKQQSHSNVAGTVIQQNRDYSAPGYLPPQGQQIQTQQQSHQQQRTEAIFTQQNQQSYQAQRVQKQNYEAPGYLPPSHEEVAGQVVSQPQDDYQAPGYLPPGQEQIAPQAEQQQTYEAPGYLPPSQGEISSGALTSAQQEQHTPEYVSQQYTHEEVVPLAQIPSQNVQSGYSYQQTSEQIASQISSQPQVQDQAGYAYQQTHQEIQPQVVSQQQKSIPQSQSGYSYQTHEQVLPEAISPQSGYSYPQSNEQIGPQTIVFPEQSSQKSQPGYAYQQVSAQISVQQQSQRQGYSLEQPSTSAVASSQPVLPLTSYPPNRTPYRHLQPVSIDLNNPRPLTSYDPPPSGIPEGLIQPQDDNRQIFSEAENPQSYDQFQPVYRPDEISEEGGSEGYDYSPPEHRFEDGQVASNAQQNSNNLNFDVLSGPSLESAGFNTNEDFNVQQQQQIQEQRQQQQQEQIVEQQQQLQQQQQQIIGQQQEQAIGQQQQQDIGQQHQQIIEQQQQQPISIDLNNPRPLTSYDPPPSGIPQQQFIEHQPHQHQQIQSHVHTGEIAGPVETIRIIDESNRNGKGRSIKTVQIYNEVVPNNTPGQIGSKTIKTIRVLDNNSAVRSEAISSNNNGYSSPENQISQIDAAIEAIAQEPNNNGYLPPTREELKSQAISDDGYHQPQPETLPQPNAHKFPTIHELLPPLPPINAPEPQQNNGYLPPNEEPTRINSHSSIASSQPIRQETNNGYLPPPPISGPEQNNGYLPPIEDPHRINSHSSIASSQPIRQETNNGYLPPVPNQQQEQNNGYLPPIENPPSSLNVHQLLPPLPELPKSHSHNEILSTPEIETNNGYLPPIRQHEEVLPSAIREPQNNRYYQAPGYLPPVPENPPAPGHQEILSSLPLSQQQSNNGQYQAPGYLPPHNELSQPSTNNAYLPPQSNAIEPSAIIADQPNPNAYLPPVSNNAQQPQQQTRQKNVKVLRIIHEKKPRNNIVQLPPGPQRAKLQPTQQVIQGIPSQGTLIDQQTIYAAAGQAVNSNVKTIRIIHERTAKTPQGRYGNSKTYLPPSIRVIRVYKKK